MSIFHLLKQSLVEEYNMKDFRKIKTIIEWQIDWNTIADTIKVYQSAFVQDLVIDERLIDYNANIIPIKAGLFIKMTDLEDYNEANLYIY